MVVTNERTNWEAGKIALHPTKTFDMPRRFKENFPGIEGVVAGINSEGNACLALLANKNYSEILTLPVWALDKIDERTIDLYLAGVLVTSSRPYAQS